VALLLAAFPASIVANADGIEQMYWLRSRRRIAWKDIASVEVNDQKSEIKIKGKNGVKILHSRQLPDRSRLLAELEKHGHKQTVVAAPKRHAMSAREAETGSEKNQLRA
jgi:hypothetical protein